MQATSAVSMTCHRTITPNSLVQTAVMLRMLRRALVLRRLLSVASHALVPQPSCKCTHRILLHVAQRHYFPLSAAALGTGCFTISTRARRRCLIGTARTSPVVTSSSSEAQLYLYRLFSDSTTRSPSLRNLDPVLKTPLMRTSSTTPSRTTSTRPGVICMSRCVWFVLRCNLAHVSDTE